MHFFVFIFYFLLKKTQIKTTCIFVIVNLIHQSYRAVVRELVETEEEFGRDLTAVVEKYIKTVENSKPPKIVSDNKDLIFGNFKQITEFHNTLVARFLFYLFIYFSLSSLKISDWEEYLWRDTSTTRCWWFICGKW